MTVLHFFELKKITVVVISDRVSIVGLEGEQKDLNINWAGYNFEKENHVLKPVPI